MSNLLRRLGIAVLASVAGHLCVFGILVLARALIGTSDTATAKGASTAGYIANIAVAFTPVTFPLAMVAALFLIWRYARPLRRLGTFLWAGACFGALFPALYIIINLVIGVIGGATGPFDMVFRIIAFALLLFAIPCALGGMIAAAVTRLGIRQWLELAPDSPQIPQSGSSIS